MKFFSASEAAERWNLSKRRVITLCNEGRIDGVQKAGMYWIIPEDAKRPSDARVKSGKYLKRTKSESDDAPTGAASPK